MLRKLLALLTSLVALAMVSATGCSPTEPLTEPFYVTTLYTWNGTGWQQVNANASGTLASGSGVFSGSVTADTVNITGTVWEDIRTPVNAVKVSGTRPPTWTAFRGSEVLGFSDQNVAINEEEVFFSLQLPHNYKIGTDLYLHLHWVYSTNETATVVRWGLTYSWASLDTAFPIATTIYANTLPNSASGADIHRLTSFPLISGAGTSGVSSMLVCRLFRNSSAATDNYTGSIYLLEIDAHYLLDSLGSSTELLK
jgi:hypothetical protein